MDQKALADRLRGCVSGDGPLHERVAAGLAAAIGRGEVLPGSRLPTERCLASALSVGRGTIAAAYGSLTKQGLVTRRQGSGTWVEPVGERSSVRRGGALARTQNRLFAISAADAPPGAINFMMAAPAAVPAVRRLAAEAAREVGRLSEGPGYALLGYPPLRREIARRLTGRGLETAEADVLVTTGAQQAIALTAQAFARPDDFVLLEDPTYPSAIDAYRQAGARILSLPVGEQGIDLDYLDDVLRRAPASLVYATPSFQNPTGALTPPGSRGRLAQVAGRHGAVLVDDEAQAELALDDALPPPVAAFGGEASTITIGSLSKIFWGGLRVGWIRAPQPLLSQLARLKAILDLSSSLPSQVLATLLLQHADEVVPPRLEEVRSGRALLRSLVSSLLPGWGFTAPTGGLVLWARLPYGSASELADVARGHGVLILPGSTMSASGRFDDRVRLPYVARPDVMEEGVSRLARAWRAYGGGEAAGDRPMGVVV